MSSTKDKVLMRIKCNKIHITFTVYSFTGLFHLPPYLHHPFLSSLLSSFPFPFEFLFFFFSFLSPVALFFYIFTKFKVSKVLYHETETLSHSLFNLNSHMMMKVKDEDDPFYHYHLHRQVLYNVYLVQAHQLDLYPLRAF